MGLTEIQKEIAQLSSADKLELSAWLQGELGGLGGAPTSSNSAAPSGGQEPKPTLPDYKARRLAIFGDKVLPNMVLEAREMERW